MNRQDKQASYLKELSRLEALAKQFNFRSASLDESLENYGRELAQHLARLDHGAVTGLAA